MEVKFIGTGSGKSSLKRYHSSILISSNSTKVLIDTGDGVARALLSTSESFNKIDSIIISHYHPDHYSGLASLLVQMKILERKTPLNIFTHSKLKIALKDFISSCNILPEYLDFNLNIISFEFDEKIQIADSFICIPKQNLHITNKYILNTNWFSDFDSIKNSPLSSLKREEAMCKIRKPISNKYDVNAGMQFISCSFLFEVESKIIFYTADIGDKEDLYLFKKSNPDLMIVDSTHIPLEEIEEAVNNLAIKKVYLSHISDEDEEKIIDWVKTKNIVDSNYFIAEDGLVLIS